MKKRLVLITILVLGLLFLATTAVSADQEGSADKDILLAGSLGGDISAVAVDGSLAYIGEGSNLVVMDVSDPSVPTSIARLTLPGVVYDLVISAGVAYIADGAGGLQVVDIHNPSQVYILRNLATACPATNLFLDGNLLYLGEDACGLQIIDISTPGIPLLRGSYPGVVNDTWEVGGLAYLVGENLTILNVSNPDTPVLLGTFVSGYELSSVQVSGDYAFADNMVIDVSNPVSPTFLTQLQISFSIKDMVFSGGTAYALSNRGEILPLINFCQVNVLDLSDPLTPVEIGVYSRQAIGSQDCDGHLFYDSGSVYAANGNFEVIDVNDPQNPTLLGGYVSRLRPADVQTKGRLAYLVDEQKGLLIMDADDVDNPILVGSYPYSLPESANQLLVSGNRAYISVHIPTNPRALAGKLDILDISNPVSPTLMGSFGVSGILDMYMDGGRAYLIDSRYAFPPQLEIVDISTPSDPQSLAVYGTTIDHLTSVYAKGDYVYVYNYDRLQVLDVSNPVSPTLSGRLDCKYLTDIQGTGNLIYGLAYTSLYFIDITNPVSPTIVNQYDYAGDGYQLQVTNGLASIALHEGGVEIVDVHDPLSPVKLASYDTPGSASAVQAIGDTLYVSDGAGGLQVLRYTTWTSALLENGSGSLVSPDESVRYDFPPGTFSAPVTVTHVIRARENAPSTGAQFNVGQDFEVSAVYSDSGLPAQPQLPFTVTVNYSDNSAFESSLGLYSWDGSQWVPAQASHVIPDQNQVVATPDHFSFWALLGETRRIYLPLLN